MIQPEQESFSDTDDSEWEDDEEEIGTCHTHSVKNVKFSFTEKIFRQINYLVTSILS